MALHDDGTMSDHDFAIAEMKYYREQRRLQELYEISLSASMTHIQEVISEEQLKSWKLVETLIRGESTESENPPHADHIRKMLMEG